MAAKTAKKTNGKARPKSKASQPKTKPQQRRGWLVPDVEVRTAKRTLDASAPTAVAPPVISRSRDLIAWLETDCAEWCEVIGTLAQQAPKDSDKGPVLEVIGSAAWDLCMLVRDISKALRTGTMPHVSDGSQYSDPVPFLAAATELCTSGGASDRVYEQLLGTVERVAGPLYQKAMARKRAEWDARPSRRQQEEEEVILGDYIQEKLKRLRAKRDARIDAIADVATAELDAEIEAIEKEESKRFDRRDDEVRSEIRSPEYHESERRIEREVERRLNAEGLDAAPGGDGGA